MPGSHQSSLLNGSQWVIKGVSDKHSQWSDSGPIKIQKNAWWFAITLVVPSSERTFWKNTKYKIEVKITKYKMKSEKYKIMPGDLQQRWSSRAVSAHSDICRSAAFWPPLRPFPTWWWWSRWLWLLCPLTFQLFDFDGDDAVVRFSNRIPGLLAGREILSYTYMSKVTTMLTMASPQLSHLLL